MYKTIMHYLFLMAVYALFYSHFHNRRLGQIFLLIDLHTLLLYFRKVEKDKI